MPSSGHDRWIESFRDGVNQHDGAGPPLPVIGRYALEEAIGEGATATVYRALDRELNRVVAVKLLRDPLAISPISRERFRREAAITASLSHPNLVAVYDAGESEGRLYLVMELVDGAPLGDRLRSGASDRMALLRLLQKAAEAVGSAHAQGIVHRDLKPGNILVTSTGEPKVGDFGLARVAGSATALTRSGAVIGTPLYMAPEQVRGDSEAAGARTDVYALGAVLYEILTRRPPHTGETVSEIYGRILTGEPASPRRLDPTIPRDLETITLKALAREPGERYSDAREFADDLRRYLGGEAIHARPPGRLEVAWKWIRRRRFVAAALLTAAVAVAGWTATTILHRTGTEEARNRREKAERLEEAGRLALEKIHPFLYGREINIDAFRRQIEEGRKFLEEAAAIDPGRPTAHYLLGRAWEAEGNDARAEASWTRAVSLDPRFGAAHYRLGCLYLRRSFLSSFRAYADDSHDLGESQAAATQAEREIQAAAATPGFDDPLARQFANAVSAYYHHDPARALEIARKGIADFGTREGSEQFACLIGWILQDHADGLPALEMALEIRPQYPLALVARAGFHSRAARYEQAIEDYDRAIRLEPDQYWHRMSRAAMFMMLNRPDDAIRGYDEALRMKPDLVAAWHLKAIARSRNGDPDGAIADLTRAVELDARFTRGWVARAEVHGLKRDGEAMLSDLNEALRIDPGHSLALARRAEYFLGKNRLDEAFADFDAALRREPVHLPSLLGRAIIRGRRNEWQPALDDAQAALKAAPTDWAGRAMAEEIVARARRVLEGRRDF